MRKLVIALAALLVGSLGVLAPAGAASVRAAANPKVAIIVGATGSQTADYRANADQLYAEAIQYTTNVVRVYSPAATWSRVKAAVNGASIVIYLGHGNGWPAPYPNDATYSQKDGFGLNYDNNGDGVLTDSELRYYGEPSIRTLTPAPNAVVLLFRLCYASGNSEPGLTDPTLSVARQRADNFAAAFQAAGAKAVVAIGHSVDPYYVRALFTTSESISQYWMQAPDFHNHVLQFASARTPGRTELLDPEQATPWGFWRSLTGDMTLNTANVTAAGYGNTSTDPANIVVPGNATPVAAGSPLYGSIDDAVAGMNPMATLTTSTIVRLDSREAVTAPDGSPIFAVHTDDGTRGWMVGYSLIPRDSTAPRLWTVEDGSGTFSPDGNGYGDTLPITLRLSEPATWSVAITDSVGNPIATNTGAGDTATITWAPAAYAVPDGAYRWNLTATDSYGNGPLETAGNVIVDTTGPRIAVSGGDSPVVISPNGDKYADSVSYALRSTEGGTAYATVLDSGGAAVDTMSMPLGGDAAAVAWDGTMSTGAQAPDGTYLIRLTAGDMAGNISGSVDRLLVLDRALGFVTTSTSIFFPQDNDQLSRSTVLRFVLAKTATVNWTIVGAAGNVVKTIMAGQILAAGTYSDTWDGLGDAGALVPRGAYRSLVTTTDDVATQSQAASVSVDAFQITASDTTPARHQRITVTVVSAEQLKALPSLVVAEPHLASWSVTMTRVSTTTYRAVITLRSSSAGKLLLKPAGTDVNGGRQTSTLALALH